MVPLGNLTLVVAAVVPNLQNREWRPRKLSWLSDSYISAEVAWVSTMKQTSGDDTYHPLLLPTTTL
jgi:hypothetical protein